jgi:cell division protease FtsH
MDDITVLLGGRAAEELGFGEVTTGAQNDLERATAIARAMIMQFGMSDTLGPRVLGKRQSQVFLGRDMMEDRDYSEETAEVIDNEVHRIIEECFGRAKEILRTHGEHIQGVVAALLERESMNCAEVREILYGKNTVAAGEDAPAAEPIPTPAPTVGAWPTGPVPAGESA